MAAQVSSSYSRIMSQFQNHSVENMGEGYYDDNPIEFEDTGSHKIADDESLDSDSEDDLELNIQKTDDTSALEVRNGKDIQGIPWDKLFFTREDYRESRLKQYRNFENLSLSREGIEKVRRGKINERLKCLQGIVPGCYKTMGMSVMLGEIINYVQSLQNQVEV